MDIGATVRQSGAAGIVADIGSGATIAVTFAKTPSGTDAHTWITATVVDHANGSVNFSYDPSLYSFLSVAGYGTISTGSSPSAGIVGGDLIVPFSFSVNEVDARKWANAVVSLDDDGVPVVDASYIGGIPQSNSADVAAVAAYLLALAGMNRAFAVEGDGTMSDGTPVADIYVLNNDPVDDLLYFSGINHGLQLWQCATNWVISRQFGDTSVGYFEYDMPANAPAGVLLAQSIGGSWSLQTGGTELPSGSITKWYWMPIASADPNGTDNPGTAALAAADLPVSVVNAVIAAAVSAGLVQYVPGGSSGSSSSGIAEPPMQFTPQALAQAPPSTAVSISTQDMIIR